MLNPYGTLRYRTLSRLTLAGRSFDGTLGRYHGLRAIVHLIDYCGAKHTSVATELRVSDDGRELTIDAPHGPMVIVSPTFNSGHAHVLRDIEVRLHDLIAAERDA